MIFFGADFCQDSVYAKTILDRLNIPYKYVDITSSTDNLKLFLELRDKSPRFKLVKEHGLIGIPCFVLDDGSIKFEVYSI